MGFDSRLLLLYGLSGLSGAVCSRVGVPLPWMIGPLITTALLSSCGVLAVNVPPRTRPFGQVVVATFVGAHFSPQIMHSLLQTAPLLIAISLYVLLCSLLVAAVQKRIFGSDRTSCFLSVVPTSPVEAGVLAEGFGLDPAPIIFAQTVRIALVVTAVPFLLISGGDIGGGSGPAGDASAQNLSAVAFLCTLAGALLGPVVFKVLRLANPYFLGPLFMSAGLAALDFPVFDIPRLVLALAQIILGTWLGSCFRRDLLQNRRGFLSSVLVSSSMLLGLCVLGAWGLARVFEAPFATVMLGIAPGGVTEMALTAGLLGQNVALVTAMHLARIFVIMPNVGWIARLMGRLDQPPNKGRVDD